MRRIKEVGVKKALGANRTTRIFQYLMEAMFMIFLSLFIAIVLVEFLIPQYNSITGKNLAFNFDIKVMSSIFAITLFTGLLAGD